LEINGLILAGGENSRFEGLPKGSLKWDGRTLFDRVYQSLDSVVDQEVYVSVHEERPAGLPQDVPMVPDRWTDIRGPMNGICSSLIELNSPLLVLPWDMPGINVMFLREFVDSWQEHHPAAYYVQEGNQPQPFPGIYTSACVESLQTSIEDEQWGMVNWLRQFGAESFEVSRNSADPSKDALLMNVNEPVDIRDLNNLPD